MDCIAPPRTNEEGAPISAIALKYGQHKTLAKSDHWPGQKVVLWSETLYTCGLVPHPAEVAEMVGLEPSMFKPSLAAKFTLYFSSLARIRGALSRIEIHVSYFLTNL